jgi:hypothetical protein
MVPSVLYKELKEAKISCTKLVSLEFYVTQYDTG